MRRIHDPAGYERREVRVLREIVVSIKDKLQAQGVRGEKLRSLTEDLAFSVAEIIDGAALLDFGDDHLVPILGFAEGRMRNRLLLNEDGTGSDMHEFVFGVVREVFAPPPKPRSK